MRKLLWMVGATVGSAIGWWAGERFGIMTAFVLSTIGTGIGVYCGIKIAREYFE